MFGAPRSVTVRQRLATPAVLACLIAMAGQAGASEPSTVVVTVERSGGTLIVNATIDVAASPDTTWAVLTDFDHMTSFYPSLTSSKVLSRDGATWVVRQEGMTGYGLLSLPYESVREVHLEPKRRILAHNLAGTVKRMDSEAIIAPLGTGVEIRYHAEIDPDSLLARLFGTDFARREAEQQFAAMAQEMVRRQTGALPPAADSASPGQGS